MARLQIALNRCNRYTFASLPALAVDSSYGPKTMQAVSLTQAYYDIPVDGVYGHSTGDVMNWPVYGDPTSCGSFF